MHRPETLGGQEYTVLIVPAPTSTATGTPTQTATSTISPTPTPTGTATSTPTATGTATPTVTATPVARLVVNPTSGTVGQTLTFTGTGFNPSETISVSVDSLSAPALVVTTTSASGSLAATHSVPGLTYGPHTFLAQGQISHRVATAGFTMIPFVQLQPTSGAAGSAYDGHNLRLWGERDGAAPLGSPHRRRDLQPRDQQDGRGNRNLHGARNSTAWWAPRLRRRPGEWGCPESAVHGALRRLVPYMRRESRPYHHRTGSSVRKRVCASLQAGHPITRVCSSRKKPP